MLSNIYMETKLDKQEDIKPQRNEKGQLLPGNTANPLGRPKGKTIKERVKDWLEEHPEDMEAFVNHFVKENKELAWQMLEGRPSQDLTSAGEKIQIPIYGGKSIQGYNSDKEDISIKEEN